MRFDRKNPQKCGSSVSVPAAGHARPHRDAQPALRLVRTGGRNKDEKAVRYGLVELLISEDDGSFSLLGRLAATCHDGSARYHLLGMVGRLVDVVEKGVFEARRRPGNRLDDVGWPAADALDADEFQGCVRRRR